MLVRNILAVLDEESIVILELGDNKFLEFKVEDLDKYSDSLSVYLDRRVKEVRPSIQNSDNNLLYPVTQIEVF